MIRKTETSHNGWCLLCRITRIIFLKFRTITWIQCSMNHPSLPIGNRQYQPILRLLRVANDIIKMYTARYCYQVQQRHGFPAQADSIKRTRKIHLLPTDIPLKEKRSTKKEKEIIQIEWAISFYAHVFEEHSKLSQRGILAITSTVSRIVILRRRRYGVTCVRLRTRCTAQFWSSFTLVLFEWREPYEWRERFAEILWRYLPIELKLHFVFWRNNRLKIYPLPAGLRKHVRQMISARIFVGLLFYFHRSFALPTICDVFLSTKIVELPANSNFCNDDDVPQSSSLCDDEDFMSTLVSCNNHGEVQSIDLSGFGIPGETNMTLQIYLMML